MILLGTSIRRVDRRPCCRARLPQVSTAARAQHTTAAICCAAQKQQSVAASPDQELFVVVSTYQPSPSSVLFFPNLTVTLTPQPKTTTTPSKHDPSAAPRVFGNGYNSCCRPRSQARAVCVPRLS
ncbi:unnamed protein product [Laminaria digitata]